MAKDEDKGRNNERGEEASQPTNTPDSTTDLEPVLSNTTGLWPNKFDEIVSGLLLSPDTVRRQYWVGLLQAAKSAAPKIAGLVKELMQAREKSIALVAKRVEAQQQTKETGQEAEALRRALEEQNKKERLLHLLTRVSDAAEERLLNEPEFQKLFEENIACEAVIVSIDIRRSTELMLKARDPQLFAAFLTTLCNRLRRIIVRHGGIFDKFTGDGILAIFPLFYSGKDAGYLAITAAAECHQAFSEHFRASRKCFNSALADIGLGIGIDFGKVRMVEISSDLTVVGAPVVYACRMGGAPFGNIYLNVPAYELVIGRDRAYFDFEEVELPVKHEGSMQAHKVTTNGKLKSVDIPQWRIDAGLISSPYPEPD
jgi:class 3 adenylate cyclase